MNRDFDIDFDLADRSQALALIEHTGAMQMQDGHPVKHNTGVYVNPIPMDPITGLSSLDYKTAEQQGYIKLDFINNSVYNLVRDPQHLTALLNTEPPWHRLSERSFVEQLAHISAHWDLLQRMPEPINSIPRLAMFLAVIRPGKRHLVGKTWAEVAQTVWQRPQDGAYAWKHSHAVSYAHLVAIHMNLLEEGAQ